MISRCPVQRLNLAAMSRKPAPIKIIDLEEGMPTVEAARLRMQRELQLARQQGYAAVKLIHGYGSSGVGGSLRIEFPEEASANRSPPRAASAIFGWRELAHLRREDLGAAEALTQNGDGIRDLGKGEQGNQYRAAVKAVEGSAKK